MNENFAVEGLPRANGRIAATWTDEAVARLLAMIERGVHFHDIAAELGSTEKACRAKWDRVKANNGEIIKPRASIKDPNIRRGLKFLALLREHHPERMVGTIEPPKKKAAPLKPAKPRQHPTIGDIKRAACCRFSISRDELCSSNRQPHLVTARHIAMYLAKTLTPQTLRGIGNAFGGRDHKTVMDASKAVAALLAAGDLPTKHAVETITARLRHAD